MGDGATGGFKAARNRALRELSRVHPLAFLTLLAVTLFYLQPFRYNPPVMASVFFGAALLPGTILGLVSAGIVALWAALRKRQKASESGIIARVKSSPLASRAYWSDWAWAVIATSLIMSAHFLVKISIHAINSRLFDTVLDAYDRVLGLGKDPVALLVSLCQAHPWTLRSLDFVYGFGYFASVLLCVPLLAFALPQRRDRLTFAVAFNLLWIAGGALYVAFPSWGPAFTNHAIFAQAQAHMPTTRWGQGQLAQELWGVLNNPYGQRHVEFGGVAAFPSLHLAVITLLTLCAWRAWKPWGVFMAVIAALLFVGSMVTGYHYLFDSLAGIVLAAASLLLADRWTSWYLGTPRSGRPDAPLAD